MNNLVYELDLYSKGADHIAGVDEVGRGPLAGPMVTAAVVLRREHLIELNKILEENLSANEMYTMYSLINDSKRLSKNKRSLLSEFITKYAVNYTIEVIPPETIDDIGVAKATQVGFYSAINNLPLKADHILTDMFKISEISPTQQTNIIKGDSRSITIAAASIIAKVFRDRMMEDLDPEYPQYGFARNKGYGTRFHMEMLKKYGPCDVHRKSFEPIRSIFSGH